MMEFYCSKIVTNKTGENFQGPLLVTLSTRKTPPPKLYTALFLAPQAGKHIFKAKDDSKHFKWKP